MARLQRLLAYAAIEADEAAEAAEAAAEAAEAAATAAGAEEREPAAVTITVRLQLEAEPPAACHAHEADSPPAACHPSSAAPSSGGSTSSGRQAGPTPRKSSAAAAPSPRPVERSGSRGVGSGRLTAAEIARTGQTELPRGLLKLYTEPYWGGQGPIGFTTWGMNTPPPPPPATPPPRPPPRPPPPPVPSPPPAAHASYLQLMAEYHNPDQSLTPRPEATPHRPSGSEQQPWSGSMRVDLSVGADGECILHVATDGQADGSVGTPAAPAPSAGTAPHARSGAPRSARRQRAAPSAGKPHLNGLKQLSSYRILPRAPPRPMHEINKNA